MSLYISSCCAWAIGTLRLEVGDVTVKWSSMAFSKKNLSPTELPLCPACLPLYARRTSPPMLGMPQPEAKQKTEGSVTVWAHPHTHTPEKNDSDYVGNSSQVDYLMSVAGEAGRRMGGILCVVLCAQQARELPSRRTLAKVARITCGRPVADAGRSISL